MPRLTSKFIAHNSWDERSAEIKFHKTLFFCLCLCFCCPPKNRRVRTKSAWPILVSVPPHCPPHLITLLSHEPKERHLEGGHSNRDVEKWKDVPQAKLRQWETANTPAPHTHVLRLPSDLRFTPDTTILSTCDQAAIPSHCFSN